MVREFSSISELESIREKKSKLSELERELSEPMFTDLSLIPVIYEHFKEILSERTFPPMVECVTQRKKFLFIILFMFAPSYLAGGRMPHCMRKKLREVFPNIQPCTISNNCENVLFEYRNYKEFRQSIDGVYQDILERLKKF